MSRVNSNKLHSRRVGCVLKINIEQSSLYSEVEITVKCGEMDAGLERLLSNLRLYAQTFSGKKDGRVYFLKAEDVYYFDTVDEKVFIYTADCVYETVLKLFEIEERFEGTGIIRVNKSTILNLMKIDHVLPLVNGRIQAVLQNGETIIISRQYVPSFKNKLGL